MTEDEARDRAAEYATPLNELIDPDDVYTLADTWDEVPSGMLEEEIHHAVDVVLSEVTHHTHERLRETLYRRSLTCMKDDMTRAPMGHLTFETKREAVAEMYWPYDMTHTEVMFCLADIFPTVHDIPTDYYQEAHMSVSHGLADGMEPDEASC